MMWHEFEQIAGYEVSFDDYYNIIEPMYMATQLSKTDFIACLNKKRFALKPLSTLIRAMKNLAITIKANCTHFTDWNSIEALNEKVQEYIGRKYSYKVSYQFREESVQGCYYPTKVVIYDTYNYNTLEEIKLQA